MSILITLVAIIVGVALIVNVLNACKNKSMREGYALMWIAGALGIIFLGIFPQTLEFFADIFDVFWEPSILIFLLLVLVFFMLFQQTLVLSNLSDQNAELTMNFSILKNENQELKQYIVEMGKEHEDFNL